jgi:hypothetical protein
MPDMLEMAIVLRNNVNPVRQRTDHVHEHCITATQTLGLSRDASKSWQSSKIVTIFITETLLGAVIPTLESGQCSHVSEDICLGSSQSVYLLRIEVLMITVMLE